MAFISQDLINKAFARYSTFKDPLHDSFGQELMIGDVILIASPMKRGDTSYSICLIIGRTEKMIRIRKVGEGGFGSSHLIPTEDQCESSIMCSFSFSGPRRWGAVFTPWNCVRIQKEMFTEDQIKGFMIQRSIADQEEASEAAQHSALFSSF